MDACEAYARQLAKKEDVELDTLSEWIKSISEVVKRRIRLLIELSWICCLTSQLTIFQSYMWRHIDVQADWRRSWTYGRAPNAIDISQHSVNTRPESIFRDPDVVRELSRLHENFVIVPADKASNNYTFVCKRHYVDIDLDRGTWTPFTSWKLYIQSDRFFCIRGVRQPQIGPHILRNTVK